MLQVDGSANQCWQTSWCCNIGDCNVVVARYMAAWLALNYCSCIVMMYIVWLCGCIRGDRDDLYV